MPNDKDAEIKSRYEDYSVEELKEAFQTIFLYTTDYTEADIEEMDKIVAVLKKKNPVPRKYTTEESWKLFQGMHEEELSRLGVHDAEEVVAEKPEADTDSVQLVKEANAVRPIRHSRLLRVGMIAAIIVVIAFAAAITASALGYNIFNWVPKWNNEIISFGGEETEPNELYDSSPIAVTLAQLGIDEPLYPHWLPEGFRLTTSVVETDPLFLHEIYYCDERYISITIGPKNQIEMTNYQKDENLPITYVIGERTHFIVSDISCYTATWQTQDFFVQITGNISLDEIELIINSVYEVYS